MAGKSIRTPLSSVRGLGSAKEGAGHFIKQRVTAIALIVLVPLSLLTLMCAIQGGYEGAVDYVSNPLVAILFLLTTGAAFYHMRLGMQVVIEDYIAKHTTRAVLLMLNTFVSIALFAAAAYSIVRIGLGA
ncbi:succinate dehydrogenase, hydrophobic membrane anchor protein [Ponticaulis sp.]|uniref:succinate dehydrogenase, hydrophobic membrane anchor protein n=1 Tax=Ponticaulis sp. TaxID=2020902 RepID=UPI000B68EA15|nr:succinate dehydrogenase, hydrophobic membrane anchor protein [Ponticaulis sp.]MAI90257.1 succinate dehydrogenase, hydrophobic membrane anchor protein [Ponticaulis sp.]OUX99900.1 MAG: succinate dehydrogenase, hydrophobic membrane anchor protein [Hyphomonadaceae bacterium TMED5]|tara:strand:- start:236751 stop:237140 length:390 start_codon:yes stop_codon:yes gene_type:complete